MVGWPYPRWLLVALTVLMLVLGVVVAIVTVQTGGASWTTLLVTPSLTLALIGFSLWRTRRRSRNR